MIRTIIPLYIISLILPACTHNNGDIGSWFGTWKVTEITIDGAVDSTYKGNMFWMFQSSVMCMRTIDDHHGATDHWGTWKELSGTTLELNFAHHDDDNDTGSWKYRPAPASHLPADVSIIDILHLTGSAATLSYTSSHSPSTTITYNLQKW